MNEVVNQIPDDCSNRNSEKDIRLKKMDFNLEKYNFENEKFNKNIKDFKKLQDVINLNFTKDLEKSKKKFTNELIIINIESKNKELRLINEIKKSNKEI